MVGTAGSASSVVPTVADTGVPVASVGLRKSSLQAASDPPSALLPTDGAIGYMAEPYSANDQAEIVVKSNIVVVSASTSNLAPAGITNVPDVAPSTTRLAEAVTLQFCTGITRFTLPI